MRTLSPDPNDRLGVYKRLADVPDRDRLRRFADEYEGRDVWAAYVAATDRFERNDSDRYEQDTTRAVDHYLHTYYRDVEAIYRERMFLLDL